MSEEYEDPKGGEPRYEGDGPSLRYDDFVGRIVQDPNEPPDVTLLSGYLGSSSEEEHVRLYLDEGLSRYVEIPEKAILHTQELPPEQSPLGGSLVWIDSGAEVVHGPVGSERRRATFLEGQIAQDYMGGGHDYGATGGITTQTRACVAIPQTVSIRCSGAVSQSGPCIPKTEIAICRTLTGILCTRFGPFCRRTIFEPHCTFAGPLCGHSVYYRCPTQNQSYCQESGFFGCNPEITIWEEQFGPHTVFERRGGGGGFDPNVGVFETGFNCPSVFDNCATRESFCPSQLVICQSQFGDCITRSGCVSRFIRCPTTDIRCQTFTGPRCITRDCEFDTAVRCISRSIRCPTRGEPRCFASRSFACPDTAAGCQVDSAFCGFDPAGGRAQGFEPMAFNMQQTQTPACYGGPPGHPTQHPGCPTVQTQTSDCVTTQTSACTTGPVPTENCHGPGGHPPTANRDCQTLTSGCPEDTRVGPNCHFAEGGGAFAVAQTQFCPSRVIRCPSVIDLCPTRVCPSRYTPCQSQFIRCPSALDACPTRFNCPSLPNGCPGHTQFGACETFGACPSAVDACPTRFGCFQTQVCGQSIACFPGGGGGGFDPGGFGGGGGFGRGF